MEGASAGHLLAAAAANNAAWCAAMCRSHGTTSAFAHDAWTSGARTPPLYPDAVTLVPDVDAHDLLTRVDASPGCSVKDSFATLDLAPHGFRVLFDAQWIVAPAVTAAATRTSSQWSPVADATALARWEGTWRGEDGPGGLFRPGLFDDDAVIVLAGRVGDRITSGAVLYDAAGVVGISNVFGPADAIDDVWLGLARAAADRFPGQPLVGYESGDALTAACRAGCTPTGPLRIWVRDDN
jgi:hypothetical protein